MDAQSPIAHTSGRLGQRIVPSTTMWPRLYFSTGRPATTGLGIMPAATTIVSPSLLSPSPLPPSPPPPRGEGNALTPSPPRGEGRNLLPSPPPRGRGVGVRGPAVPDGVIGPVPSSRSGCRPHAACATPRFRRQPAWGL